MVLEMSGHRAAVVRNEEGIVLLAPDKDRWVERTNGWRIGSTDRAHCQFRILAQELLLVPFGQILV
jgi:hypothetical protein